MSRKEIPSQGLKNAEGPRPDPRINIIAGKAPASQPCPYSTVYNDGVGWALYCNIMMRYLTKHEAEYCIKHADSCPMIKYMSRTME
jgi:hypothetical protein